MKKKGKQKMKTNNIFDKKGFMQWFLISCNNVSTQLYVTVENLIDYAVSSKSQMRDELPLFVSEMLEDIEFYDVARFCSDSILTNSFGKREKARAMAA